MTRQYDELVAENARLQTSVDGVRDQLTKLAMARSDDPYMGHTKLLTVLADFVDGICAAVGYDQAV